VQVDWNQIQARMTRVGVVGYQKQVQPAPSAYRWLWRRAAKRGAQGETEAAAVVMALQQAEMAEAVVRR